MNWILLATCLSFVFVELLVVVSCRGVLRFRLVVALSNGQHREMQTIYLGSAILSPRPIDFDGDDMYVYILHLPGS